MKSQHSVADTMRELLIDLTLFAGALFVRWIAILQTPVIASDSILYIKAAKFYSQGAYHDALLVCSFSILPLFISYLYKFFGDWVLTGQWISALLGSLTVIPLYLLAKRIFDEKIALWGAVFYIICPTLVRYSAEVLRDTPFIIFFIMALWLGFKGIKDGNKISIVFASIFGYLSLLFRLEGFLLLLVLFIYLIWLGVRESLPLKKIIIALIILVFFFPGVVSSFGVYYYKKVGRLNLDQLETVKAHFATTLYHITTKRIDNVLENEDLSRYEKNLFQLAREHRFTLYVSHIAYKLIKVFTIPLFLLFIFGVVKRKEVRYRGDEFLLVPIYGIFIAAFLFHLSNTNYLSTRYPFPLVVPSLIWCGVGFVEFKERGIQWIRVKVFPFQDHVIRWLVPLVLAAICIPLLAMAWAPNRKDKLELKEIGLWLKGHGYASSTIAGQYEFIRLAFYADGEFIEIPKGNYRDIIRFAREKNAKVLVINKKTIDYFSPHFLELVSPRDLQQISIPEIKTPKYATTVFKVKHVVEE